MEEKNGWNTSVVMDCDYDKFEPTIKKLKEIEAEFLTMSIHRKSEDELSLFYYFRHERRILVINVRTKDKLIPSLYSHYAKSDLIEREIYKLFGIKFLGHPNLEKIGKIDSSSGDIPTIRDITE